MSTATLSGNTCTRALLQLPAWGRGWADVELAEPLELSGGQTLTIADASYAMAIVSGGLTREGRARYRLVAGTGGWSLELPAKPYQNDAGVDASLLIADAARECGESVGVLPSTTFGSHFARKAGTASDILHLCAPRDWYVDPAGVTQFGPRATVIYEGDATRITSDPAAGVIELAADEVGTLAPGVIVDGSAPATDVEIEVGSSRLTVRVYFAAQRTRRAAAMAKIINALFPWLRYCGTYDFRVVTQSGERLNLQPVRAASGLPDLARVPVCPGVSGWRSDVTLGEIVKVAFADHDPSRPYVFAHDHADSSGWLPTLCEFGDGDFLAQKAAVDAIQQNLDTMASFGTPWGPTTPGNLAAVGPQQSCQKLKGE